MVSVSNQLMIYPAPPEAVGNSDFTVRVRQGNGNWQELFCYNVRVDMHEVRNASMVYFDCAGPVEVEVVKHDDEIQDTVIRPASAGIDAVFNENRLTFRIDGPRKLSLEVNGDRFHNLHIFANPIEEETPCPEADNVLLLQPAIHRTVDVLRLAEERRMPDGPEPDVIYFAPGMHYMEETLFQIPEGKTVYIAGGAVVVGSLICDRVKDVVIRGRGVIDLAVFHRFSAFRGIRITYSENIAVEGIIVNDPPHYSILIGQSSSITIRNFKSFSTRGWSDGIDIMSSSHVDISDVFMRNSDDCIAVYASRWNYQGDTRDISVRNAVLWADVAHPMNVGGHGNPDRGDVVENILFENIDVLEHHEPQPDYRGCMSINVGDNNTVRNVTYRKIRVEQFELGRLFDIRVLFNPKYNPSPGFRVEHICYEDITFNGSCDNRSVIEGYNESRIVESVKFKNLRMNGRHVTDPKSARIHIGKHAHNITFL